MKLRPEGNHDRTTTFCMCGKFEKRYKCYHSDGVLTKTASKEEYNPGARKEARDRPGVTTSYSESVTDD